MAPYMDPPSSPSQTGFSTPRNERVVIDHGAPDALPIAICGMALRLPGGISSTPQFWDFLVNKKDARAPVPPTRYNISSFHSKTGKSGSVRADHGYFLDESIDIGAIDTSFFGMTKAEIEMTDPQQRLLLEVTRECFESAGETNYHGKAIGTYVGTFGDDWLELANKDSQFSSPYKIPGHGDFALSNRISYEYDLRGPSMTIKTGCSAALVGLHQACLAIRGGECSAAIVGGCNLIMAPGLTVSSSEQGVLSPNGSCRTFDAEADGYARAEAINVVYIKKLSDAIRDGNPIRAVIRSTFSLADGRTSALTVPSAECHEVMMRRAYAAAGISNLSETAFVECHGTATPTGDPIETSAVGNVFGQEGVYIGSVKPNVGHSEGASGLTSLIKSVLALEHQVIPPNIKFEKPNPKIAFEEKKLKVAVEPTPWPKDRRERVSVNSFGIGGSNAHVIMDSARSFLGALPSSESTIPHHPQLMVFSANTADSLRRQVANHQKYIEEHPAALANAAYTLGVRRAHLPHRAFSVVGDGVEPNTSSFTKAPLSSPDLIMVFTGQGAQWPQMGAELLQSNQTFASAIQQMDKALRILPDAPSWTIAGELLKPSETSNLHLATISQPLCTAVQVGLVAALADIGIRPSAVVGHSSGEMAAAYAAGRLSAVEAITAAYYRGVVSGEVTADGAMAAVGMGWEETTQFLRPGVIVACENSPSSVTISGDKDHLDEVLDAIREARPDVLARLLKVDKAYHSHHMKIVGETYVSLVSRYLRGNSELVEDAPAFFSSVTGKRLALTDITDAAYWRSNLESPVLFRTAVANLVEFRKSQSDNRLIFLEVGPHSALSGPLRQTLAQASLDCPYSSCLQRSTNATVAFLSAMGQLWAQNVSIDFQRLTNPHGTAAVVSELPTYPWQHDQSYFFETRLAREWRLRRFPSHELLGVRIIESTDNEPAWRNALSLQHCPWLRDHCVNDDIIFPCAGYVGMVGEAARQLCDGGDFEGFSLRNVVIDTAMVLHDTKSSEIVTSMRRQHLTDSLESQWYDFVVSSHNSGGWLKHCSGQVCALTAPDPSRRSMPLEKLPRHIEVSKWYQTDRFGLRYGPYFQGLKDVSCSATESVARGTAMHTIQDDEEEYCIHPTKIDFFLQLFGVAAYRGIAHNMRSMKVPTFVEKIDVYKSESEIQITIEADATTRGGICGSGDAVDSDGRTALRMTGAKLSPLQGETSEDSVDPHAGARTFWRPDLDFQKMSTLIKARPDQEQYVPLCDKLLRLCIQEALRRLEEVETEVPHLRAFQGWMQKQPLPTTDITMDSLVTTFSTTRWNAFVVAMMKVLDNIVSVFKSETEPLEVLMPDNVLTNVYIMLQNSDRGSLFQSLCHARPNMRILEIGAGTGGTTDSLLNCPADSSTGKLIYSTYTYTDVSAGFFDAAKERFKAFPNMEFRPLDISRDPLEQGFEANSFDLVLAANVLHVTPSLRATLANVHKLLRPDGRLYLEEMCCTTKAANFVMGILPGWWSGAADGRPDEPYVSPEHWDRELRKAGFAGLQDVALDCASPNQQMAFMIARPAFDAPRAPQVTLLHDQASADLVGQLAPRLEAEGLQVHLANVADGLPVMSHDIVSILDVQTPYLEDIGAAAFEYFRELSVRSAEAGVGIFWLTRSSQVACTDPRWAQITGAARTIRKELEMDFATCEMDSFDTATWDTVAKVYSKFHRRLSGDSAQVELEYAIHDGVVYVPRVYPAVVDEELQAPAEDNGEELQYELAIGKIGRLNSLGWVARAGSRQLGADEVLVEVKAVGLNFRDVLVAMGIVDARAGVSTDLGVEASGVVKQVGSGIMDLRPGDRIVALGAGWFSTDLIIDANLCFRIPDSLSYEDAATMPCVAATTIYGLLDVGRLQNGETVLIHSACGGVGIAAIQLCKAVGAEIYCTVGSEEKIQHLIDNYGIPRDHIFHSRDASFLPEVMKATHGRGIDLVLNSLSGELLHASWDCVAKFGRLIEVGKRDLIGNGKLALKPFLENRSYQCVDLAGLIYYKPRVIKQLLKRIIQYYEDGSLKPIGPIRTFSAAETAAAFLFMQKGQHIGKIVISMDVKADPSSVAARRPATDAVFHQNASYLLAGGLGGLGRVLANWMVERGARHLVFLSRTAGEGPGDQAFFAELRSQGCVATAVRGNSTSLADVQRAVAASPNLKGVFNLSMVLRDQNFTKMTHDEWTAAVQPKVRGTWNLHEACLKLEQGLDFFVLFGSTVGVLGQRGQANYASGNTFMDAFTLFRRQQGLPASSIDVGLMIDYGYAAERPLLLERLHSQGHYGLSVREMLDAVTLAVRPPLPTPGTAAGGAPAAVVNPSQLVIGMRTLTPMSDPSNRVVFKRDRRMAFYLNQPVGNSGGISATGPRGGGSGGSDALAAFLATARLDPAVLDTPDAPAFVARQVVRHLHALLLRPVDDGDEEGSGIDVGMSLQEAGLDSLVAIEVRTWWKAMLGFDISVLEMLGLGSVLALGERAVAGLRERLNAEGGVEGVSSG